MLKKCLGLGLGLLFFCGSVAAIPLKVTCTNDYYIKRGFSVNENIRWVDHHQSESLEIPDAELYKVRVFKISKPGRNDSQTVDVFNANYSQAITKIKVDSDGHVSCE